MKTSVSYKQKASKIMAHILSITLIISFISFFYNIVQISHGANSFSPPSPWSIDLFIQRDQQYYGKGINQSGGTYEPFEEVKLCAIVTYKNVSRSNLPVSFQVIGPLNSSKPFMLFRSATTDREGMASISFRIPVKDNSEESVIGLWQAFSVTEFIEPVGDMLFFEVKWPITITSVRLLNEQGIPQSRFAQGEPFTVELTMKNSASNTKYVKLALTIRDSAQTQIEQVEINDIKMDIGAETTIKSEFRIPVWAALGEGTIESKVYSGRYKATNIPAGKSKTTKFSVITRAVAIVEANLSHGEIYAGQPVNITLRVENRGNETEELYIKINCNGELIGKLTATLAVHASKVLIYSWNTSEASEGHYILTAEVERVPWETECEDNKITIGTIRIRHLVSPYIVNLFILLLVITGILTFTLLMIWGRRQQVRLNRIKPNFEIKC